MTKLQSGLNDKQERFCREYLIDLNATQAAIRAGYGKAGAAVHGSRALTNPKISARITEMRIKQGERLEITADRVLKEWATIAFAPLNKLGNVKVADKKGALDSIAKHLGMFTNKELDASGFQVVIRSVLDPKP